MLKEYQTKETFKAEQFDGSYEMIKKYNLGFWKGQDTGEIYEYSIPTKEGVLDLNVGDWIAVGVNDEHWVISDEIFKKLYEEVEETPPRKYKVWISSPDNNSFNEEDEFEVTNESEEEIEQIAKDFAFEHIEWGYEEVKDE